VSRPSNPNPEPVQKGFWRRTVSEWAVTIVVYFFVTTCVVQGYVIPTPSMENTLLIGDHLLVDKLSYAPADPWLGKILPYQEVQRGDVIVFRFPLDLREVYVKRVIAVPGDQVRIVDKQVVLNGRAIEEPYKVHKTPYIDSYRDIFPSMPNVTLPDRALAMLEGHVRAGELLVPPDNYFAMGDNRDLSSDSRYWGFVPRENIIGKPLLVYWSYDAPTEQLMEPLSLKHAADVALHFFARTRWERSFTRVEAYRAP
jgi:signal peptidase I